MGRSPLGGGARASGCACHVCPPHRVVGSLGQAGCQTRFVKSVPCSTASILPQQRSSHLDRLERAARAPSSRSLPALLPALPTPPPHCLPHAPHLAIRSPPASQPASTLAWVRHAERAPPGSRAPCSPAPPSSACPRWPPRARDHRSLCRAHRLPLRPSSLARASPSLRRPREAGHPAAEPIRSLAGLAGTRRGGRCCWDVRCPRAVGVRGPRG